MRAVVLLTLLSSLPLCAAESVAATPWDVRKDSQELLDDLSHHRGDERTLLEQAQKLMSDHGDALINIPDGSAPIYEVVAKKLHELGLDKAFIAAFQVTATNRLQGLGERASDQQLLLLARGYPGTDAAMQAWVMLADRAWDSGMLSRFLAYARSAGDSSTSATAPRHQRYLAAEALLLPNHTIDLPASFTGLTEIWRLPVELQAGRPQNVRQNDRPNIQPLSLATIPGEATAASDGIQVLVVDHLIGRQQAPPLRLGDVALPARECRPTVIRDGFAALGEAMNGQKVVVMGIDELGNRLWQTFVPGDGQPAQTVLGVSAPLTFDNLVVFAVTTLQEENANLSVHAIDAHTGAHVWDSEVTRLGDARRAMFQSDPSMTPMTCIHDGSLLVLSNCGMVARVSADGLVQRTWSYPSSTEDINAGVTLFNHAERSGAILSDGATAVITPADNAGLALIVNGDGDPEIYRGDGAGGSVLALSNGLAIFGLHTVTCFDVATKTARWSKTPHEPLKNPQAFIGKDSVLILSDDARMLLSLKDGAGDSEKSFETRTNLNASVVDQTLLFGGTDFISAWGGSASTLEQITNAAKAAPTDFRPRVRLAALLNAHNDADGSFNAYLEALRLGAPDDYAERAAHGLRDRLELSLGDDKTFPAIMSKLDALTPFDVNLKNEAIWWRARHAETKGDATAAANGYRQVIQGPSHVVTLRDGVQADLRVLARGGLFRLHLDTQPLAGVEVPIPLASPASPWSVPGHLAHNTKVTGNLVIGYVDGFLTALHLQDGSQAWQRTPIRPLLGVMNTDSQRTDGIVIHVMNGSSAEAAGMVSGDVLVRFNDTDIKGFTDLQHAVTGAAIRSPYKAVVLRGEERVELHGMLGGEMVEPTAVNDRTVLISPITIDNRREGLWISALDLVTGKELFSPPWTVPASERETESSLPLLTPDDTIIVEDAVDIVALRAHAIAGVGAGHEIWRIASKAKALDHASLIGTRLLWLPVPERGRGELIDTTNGESVASIPCDSLLPPLIDGYDVFARQGDLTLCSWDLAAGRLRWRSTQTVAVVVAANSDSVYVITQEGQLAILDRFSGKLRRTLGSWAGVSPQGSYGDLEFFSVRDNDADAVVSLNLKTATIGWEELLPNRTELQTVTASAEGLIVTLREGDSDWLLHLQLDGKLTGVMPAEADHDFFSLTSGLLDAGPKGFHVVQPTLPSTTGKVDATTVLQNADLSQMAALAQGHLRWNACGGGSSYAIVRAGLDVLIFARSDKDAKDVIVHLADAGHAMDAAGMFVTFSPSDSTVRFDRGTGTWQMSSQTQLGKDADAILVARLQPPPDRVPTWPLIVRGEAAGAADAPPGPWWLCSTWHVLGLADSAKPPAPPLKK